MNNNEITVVKKKKNIDKLYVISMFMKIIVVLINYY